MLPCPWTNIGARRSTSARSETAPHSTQILPNPHYLFNYESVSCRKVANTFLTSLWKKNNFDKWTSCLPAYLTISLFRTSFAGCYAFPCISLGCDVSICQPYFSGGLICQVWFKIFQFWVVHMHLRKPSTSVIGCSHMFAGCIWQRPCQAELDNATIAQSECLRRKSRTVENVFFAQVDVCGRFSYVESTLWDDLRCPQFAFLRWSHFQERTPYIWIREFKGLKLRVRNCQVVARTGLTVQTKIDLNVDMTVRNAVEMPGTDLLRPLASWSSFSCHPRHRERSCRQGASQNGRWWRVNLGTLQESRRPGWHWSPTGRLSEETSQWACAHYVMVSKFQWKPFWLATQRDPQNDWTATQNRVNYDVFAHAPYKQRY